MLHSTGGRAKAYYQSDVRTARFGTLAWLTCSCMRTPKTSRQDECWHTRRWTRARGLLLSPMLQGLSHSRSRRHIPSPEGQPVHRGVHLECPCQFGPSRETSSRHRWTVPTRKAVCSMRPVRTRPPRAIFSCQRSRSMFLTPRQCWARWKSDKRLVFSDGRSSPSMPNSTGKRT